MSTDVQALQEGITVELWELWEDGGKEHCSPKWRPGNRHAWNEKVGQVYFEGLADYWFRGRIWMTAMANVHWTLQCIGCTIRLEDMFVALLTQRTSWLCFSRQEDKLTALHVWGQLEDRLTAMDIDGEWMYCSQCRMWEGGMIWNPHCGWSTWQRPAQLLWNTSS